MDEVFKALADPSRRRLLDALNARNGQSLRELCAGLDMTRQAVAKHVAVLEAAELVTTARHGREKLHYLNAAPINDIADRWIHRYDRARARALADLRQALEESTMSGDDTGGATSFVYVTYISTTPERLWQALTDSAFTARYFEGCYPSSDWQVGSPVLWNTTADDRKHDWDQRVLEADPPRRLSYRWHGYEPEMPEYTGWSPEEFEKRRGERRSKVTFDIETAGSAVKLTVTHDDLEPGSEMLRSVSRGWPVVLSNLKTLLESGETLQLD
ncbi:ArsR family transcriptional regulator [Streptomonospora alba]|uniref:ArsR family transcriptional regulator n=1 Tax=Streptomonospora alba TaxID=183763 RepID=A0A0C2G4S0_9ACTN|nr:metalloregulator ArsR/SmtB family transcription factor [Streptomonospora alba]KIH98268.1 ArsR family transcriptional regulator [Streptomonospora alba]